MLETISNEQKSPVSSCEENEIDLRDLIVTLWHGRRFILLISVGLALLVLIINLILPKQYQAEVSLILTQPKVRIEAEEGVNFIATKADIETAKSFALSAEVFQALMSDAEIQSAWKGEDALLTWELLIEKADVTEIGEQKMQLVFQDTDPQRAALVVNHWAKEAIKRINANYGFGVVLDQMALEAKSAQDAYQKAEDAYVQILAQDRQTILTKQIKQIESDLSCILTRQGEIQHLKDDLRTFGEYLQALPSEEALTPGDAMALTTLQQRVLATQVCIRDTSNLQTQWQTADLTALTANKARTIVKEMQIVLQRQEEDLSARQGTLEAQLLQLQQALEKEKNRLRKTVQQRNLAWETYQTLVEARARGEVLMIKGNEVAVIASQAVPPRKPSSPRVLMNTALAGILGMIFSSLAVLIWSWWRQEEPVGV